MRNNGTPINWDDLPIYPPPGEEDEYQGRVVEDRLGNRSYTLNTLVDQVINEFVAETFGRQDILAELEDTPQQIEYITEVADYVLATEYIGLNPTEKKWLINRVHRDLFRFGILEPYILDEEITEISISDLDEVYIRRGFGKLERLGDDFGFNHPLDIEQIFQRVLAPYGVELSEDNPFVEVGVHLAGRRLRISLIGPPIMPLYTAQIRLHPIQPLRLEDLSAIVPAVARDLLEKIITQGQGLLIAGDVNIAKTSLLGALLPYIPTDKQIGLVERAREIHNELITENTRLYSDVTQEFSERLHNAQEVDVLFVDEIRWDEGASFWEVLTNESIQQLVVSFRGKAHSARLQSAFMMGIRKAHQQLERQLIDHALESRLPFVAGLNTPIGGSSSRLEFLGQWVIQGDGLVLEPLIEWDGEIARRTHIPTRYPLD